MKSEVLKVFNLLKRKDYKIFGTHKSENGLKIKELESARAFYFAQNNLYKKYVFKYIFKYIFFTRVREA